MRFRLWNHDVWGNEKDGYTSNDRCDTGITLCVSEDATDKAIIRALKAVDFLRKHLHFTKFTIDGDPEYSLYIEYLGRLICELQRIE